MMRATRCFTRIVFATAGTRSATTVVVLSIRNQTCDNVILVHVPGT